jgi:hypothetical protein
VVSGKKGEKNAVASIHEKEPIFSLSIHLNG